MGLMLFFRCRGNKYVTNVCVTQVQFPGNFIYEALKGLGCVPKSERRDGELEEPERRECRDVFLCHWDMVICPYQVNGGKDLGASQRLGEILYMAKRVTVRYGSGVQAPVITVAIDLPFWAPYVSVMSNSFLRAGRYRDGPRPQTPS